MCWLNYNKKILKSMWKNGNEELVLNIDTLVFGFV